MSSSGKPLSQQSWFTDAVILRFREDPADGVCIAYEIAFKQCAKTHEIWLWNTEYGEYQAAQLSGTPNHRALIKAVLNRRELQSGGKLDEIKVISGPEPLGSLLRLAWAAEDHANQAALAAASIPAPLILKLEQSDEASLRSFRSELGRIGLLPVSWTP